VFSMTSNGWLLAQLLKQLPWPAGTTSKLFTLAQCRCPTAQLLANVESVGDTGTLKMNFEVFVGGDPKKRLHVALAEEASQYTTTFDADSTPKFLYSDEYDVRAFFYTLLELY